MDEYVGYGKWKLVALKRISGDGIEGCAATNAMEVPGAGVLVLYVINSLGGPDRKQYGNAVTASLEFIPGAVLVNDGEVDSDGCEVWSVVAGDCVKGSSRNVLGNLINELVEIRKSLTVLLEKMVDEL